MSIDHLSHAEKRALLEKLLRQRMASTRPNLDSDAQISIVLADHAADPSATPGEILLTGATGFVGAFVLRKLLDHTRARIHCLVRAVDDGEGRQRIESNLRSYDLSTMAVGERVEPVPGDLALPGLGIEPERWTWLAERVDAIHHIAAQVNLAHDYRQLKPANVEGTREIIRLAAAGRVKPLHYLSSYAVFDSMQNVGKVFSEIDEPPEHEQLSTGYAESKWVAEVMVRRAHAAGVPAAVYRVGWVIGDSRTGAWKAADFIPRLLKVAVEAGMCCDFGTFTMTPVDYVAAAFTHLASQPESLGRVFHLSNGKRYSSRSLFAWVRAVGYELREVSLEEWRQAFSGSLQELSLTPMLFFLGSTGGSMSRWLSNEPNVDVDLTRRLLEPGGIVCPDVDAASMAAYLSRLVAAGHLPRPAAGR